jgi:large subunit ribosomal protein L29
MKYTDLAQKSVEELTTLLKEKKTELFTLRMKKRMMQLTNTAEIAQARKTIAQINTAITAAKQA